jgi:hypothetical protein
MLLVFFSQYKFALAFENNNVTDYVTEKYVNVLQAGTVPVYMGAPNIDSWVPGERAIIKTSDFSGPAVTLLPLPLTFTLTLIHTCHPLTRSSFSFGPPFSFCLGVGKISSNVIEG